VDGSSLDGVRSVRVQQDTTFESDGRSIRCTEVRRHGPGTWRFSGVRFPLTVLRREAPADGSPLSAPAGVLPAEGPGLRPGRGAVGLQRIPEGDGAGGVRRPDASPRRAGGQRHQLAVAARLHPDRHGELLAALFKER